VCAFCPVERGLSTTAIRQRKPPQRQQQQQLIWREREKNLKVVGADLSDD